jgi:hypothetical protein
MDICLICRKKLDDGRLSPEFSRLLSLQRKDAGGGLWRGAHVMRGFADCESMVKGNGKADVTCPRPPPKTRERATKQLCPEAFSERCTEEHSDQ